MNLIPFGKANMDTNDVKTPTHLLGTMTIGLVFLVGIFTTFSTFDYGDLFIIPLLYCLTSILCIPGILWFVFMLQTKYRRKMLSDVHYFQSLKSEKNSLNISETPYKEVKEDD